MTASLSDRLIANDVFGYGTSESLPIKNAKRPEEYPLCSILFKADNVEQLYEDSKIVRDTIGERYFQDRQKRFYEITPEEMRDTLTELGFTKGFYQGYSIRNYDTGELIDLPPATTEFFAGLDVGTFRQQYAVAYNGWNTKFHIDHDVYSTHGFRCMIPLNGDSYITFLQKENQIFFRMVPGYAYFINIATTHRAFHFSSYERVNLCFQFDSDHIISDTEIGKISAAAVPLENQTYEFSTIIELP